MKEMGKTFARVVSFALLATTVSLGLAACIGETGSKRFAFEGAIGGLASNNERFVNQRGWSIQLSKATMTLGPVYLNVVPALRAQWNPLRLAIKSAWAAGEGHLGEGRIAGELGQASFDALSPSLAAFPVKGSMTQEEIRTTEIWFYPEPGVSAETNKIKSVALDLAGDASREGEVVKFRGSLLLDDAWLSANAGQRGAQSISEIRRIRGIDSKFYPTEGGSLEIRVDLQNALRGADFSTLVNHPSEPDGAKLLVQGKDGKTDPVMTNLYQGLRDSLGTYRVRWNDAASP